jgi:hypothetical protein
VHNYFLGRANMSSIFVHVMRARLKVFSSQLWMTTSPVKRLAETKITDSSIKKAETGHRCELTVSFITIYVTRCMVYCRRVYRRADCKCDNAHSLGLCWNHFARHCGFCDRRFDCTTVLKATVGFKISSRWIYPVHHWCDCSCLNCETHQLGNS